MNSRTLKTLALGSSLAVLLSLSTVDTAGAQNKPLPGAPVAVSMKEAVSVAIRTNPQYGIVANNRRATDQELEQAKALYRPSVDLSGDTGWTYNDNDNNLGANDDESLWRYNAGLTLTQMLYDGFSARAENDRQAARVLSASHRVKEASELIGLATIEAYLDVLRQREILKISYDNVKGHTDILARIQDSATVGRSTDADLIQARARLDSARAESAAVREALRAAEARYTEQVGSMPQALIMPKVPVEAVDVNVEAAVKKALTQSPTLDIFEADMQVSEAEYDGAKASLHPTLDFQLNGQEGENISGVEGSDTSASALVLMNWNLYRGGADTARIREHMHRIGESKERRALQGRAVESDVRQTWARMISSQERAKEFSDQATANVGVLAAYKDQFDLNRRSLLDVLDAQNELFVSRSNAVNSEFLQILAMYRLIALKGELVPTLGVDYPREANPATL